MNPPIRGIVIRLPLLSVRVMGTPEELKGYRPYIRAAVSAWSVLTSMSYMLTGLLVLLQTLLGGPKPSDAVLFSGLMVVALVSLVAVIFGTLTARDTAASLLSETTGVN